MRNHKVPGARTLKASEFKAKCLKLMDEVAGSGDEIVITKNGRPVSRLVPRIRTGALGRLCDPHDRPSFAWETE